MTELPAEFLPDREQRLLILGVLRANGLHQDHCQALGVARANADGGMYFLPKPCDCWLSDQRK